MTGNTLPTSQAAQVSMTSVPNPEGILEALSLSSTQLAEMMREGDIDSAYAVCLIDAIKTCKQTQTASKTTRVKVEQARSAIYKAVMLVNELGSNDQFWIIGTNEALRPNAAVLASWCELSGQVYGEMDQADRRFDRAPDSLTYPPFGPLGELAYEVLQIQARSHKTTPPAYHRNSSTHPRFEKFFYLCAQAADPELKADYPNIRNARIDRALEKVTRSFNECRSADPDGWPAGWDFESSQEDS
jgi:hypothetical protein